MTNSFNTSGTVFNFKTEKIYKCTLTVEMISPKSFIVKLDVPELGDENYYATGVKGNTLRNAIIALRDILYSQKFVINHVNPDEVLSIENENLRSKTIGLVNSGYLSYDSKFIVNEASRIYLEFYQILLDKDFNFSDGETIVTDIQALYATQKYTIKSALLNTFGAYYLSTKNDVLNSTTNIEIKKGERKDFDLFVENILTLHHRILSLDFANELRKAIYKIVDNNKVITTDILEE